ncbi:MAG TPA: hypothetical protein VK877_05990, partial [Pseudolabrys sp.]|nr:hypothetical protein [Pseudolabrys sp.]
GTKERQGAETGTISPEKVPNSVPQPFPIADLVEHLFATGASQAVIIQAIRTAESQTRVKALIAAKQQEAAAA